MGFTRFARALIVSLVVWSLVSVLHALAAYTDQLHRGLVVTFPPLLFAVLPGYAPWALFSTGLYVLFLGLRDRWSDINAVLWIAAGAFVLFYVPQTAYQVVLTQWQAGKPLSDFASAFAAWPAIFWLVDLGLFVATIAIVYGMVAFSRHLDGERRKQRLIAENLSLRLELERQRLIALRAQLEPHFLFNALNAISALVRGDNRPLALSALQQLSGLLRYALTASGRDWVALSDELAFARGYVALQELRHGDRLTCVIDVDESAAGMCDVPPLILQPLLENAIRHDLERHDGAGDIRVDVVRDADRLRIRVSNSLPRGFEPNPGTGFGLTATRDRLSLIYGAGATCESGVSGDRFIATLDLPASAPVPDVRPH